MTIHIFNPEHDIALASGLERFTAPHAGRELRHDLGFLPMLWAKAGDLVLVDDKESAQEALRHISLDTDARLVDNDELSELSRKSQLSNMSQLSETNAVFHPWGWDAALRQQLRSLNVPDSVLPSNGWLNTVRLASHRAWAASHLLTMLRGIDGTVGESREAKSVDELRVLLARMHRLVLKAPWSSSGRGIRYVADNDSSADNGSSANNGSPANYGLTPQLVGWVNNVIRRQGSVMVEPYYNKVCDFGMEFVSKGDGVVEYRGLSLFHTSNGAYTGNILDDEAHKMSQLTRLVPQEKLSATASRICSLMAADLRQYAGPFGVDMMVVKDGDNLFLHPCVELNLRMTMGHVALQLANRYNLEDKVMRITYRDGRYRLTIE